jgi:hypothetical protein
MERDESYWLRLTIKTLEAMVQGLQYELCVRDIRLAEKDKRIVELEQEVQELKKQAVPTGLMASPFSGVHQAQRAATAKEKPGRKDGHEAALRAMPARIDHHREVPLPTDRSPGGESRAWR